MLSNKQRAAMYLLLSELDQTIETHAFRLASAEKGAYPTPFEVDDARDVLVAQLATFLSGRQGHQIGERYASDMYDVDFEVLSPFRLVVDGQVVEL